MGELAKIDSFRKEVAVAETIEEVKLLTTKGELIAQMAMKLKIPKDGQNELGKTRIELEKKKRELIVKMFPKKGCGSNQHKKVEKSEKLILADVGISLNESSDAKIIKEEEILVQESIQEIEKGNDIITPQKVAAKVRKKKKQIINKKKQEERKQIIELIPEDEFKPQFLKGNFQNICDSFSENYFDHIITDPPYPKEYLEDWSDLSQIASRILKPSGFCICYSGKIHLSEVIARMTKYLDFYWQLILIHKDYPSAVHPVKINTLYKPILIFQKPPHKSQENYVIDLIYGSGREKFGHEWQQGEEELTQILQNFTIEGDLILDPFAGSGTTGFACQKNKRKSILIDINDI